MSDREKIISEAFNNGFNYERDYRGCAQCTIAAVFETLNIKKDDVFRAASGLGAGGGLLCDGVCGGYSGGIMAMGSLFGRRLEYFGSDEEEKNTAFSMAGLLHDKFIEKYGTVICKDIHNCIFGRNYNLLDPGEKEEFNNDGAHTTKCTEVVANAAAWICELILDEAERRGIDITSDVDSQEIVTGANDV